MKKKLIAKILKGQKAEVKNRAATFFDIFNKKYSEYPTHILQYLNCNVVWDDPSQQKIPMNFFLTTALDKVIT